jgi:nicotinamide-nucleotide amidase
MAEYFNRLLSLPRMRVEVINTGTELLLGNVTNKHLAFLGQALFPLGLRVDRQVCVPDGPAIGSALEEAFGRADLVVVTGGLGPTSDDITRDLVAELLHRPLANDPQVLQTIQDFFTRLGRPLNAAIARQAQVPDGATVLDNAHGTAPGLYLPPTLLPDGRQSPHVFLLPGPPRELRPMFSGQVIPMIERLLPAGETPPGCCIYRCVGIGESAVEELIGAALAKIGGLEIGYCARLGEVDVRCIGSDEMLERAKAVISPALSSHLLAPDAGSIEEMLVHRLTATKRTLAVAESCTGGLLAHRITNVPGASRVFLAGLATYSNGAKCALLGLEAALIERHGAVSREVAAAMAAGARQVTGADFALSTTGEAGPESGSGRPVGTVFVSLADPAGGAPMVEEHFFPTDREAFKQRTCQAAFDLLRRHLG